MQNTLIKFLALISTLSFLAGNALAQTPLQIEYSSIPGEIVKGQISVLNTSDENQTISIHIGDLSSESKVGSLLEWIFFPQDSFLVKANEKVVIPYEIRIPVDAPSQGYYGSLEVLTSSPEEAGLNQLILLEVQGETYQDLSIKDMTINGDTLDIVIGNTGNVHGSPEGTVELVNSRGNIIEEFQLNKEEEAILPQNTKTYLEDGYLKNLPAGIYYAIVNGKAENGQVLQGKLTFRLDRAGKIEVLDKYIGEVDAFSLKGTAKEQYVVFQTALSVLAVFILSIAFLAIGKFCIIGSKEYKKSKR